MEMTRLEAIEKRLMEIKKEITVEGADIDTYNKEVDALLNERQQIKSALEQRKKTLQKIAIGGMGEGTGIQRDVSVRLYTTESPEYRSAYLKRLRNLELSELEERAFTSASSSAGPAIPKQTADEIIRKLKQRAPLLNEITLLQVNGNVSFAVEGTINDAQKHTENKAITADSDTLIEVALTGYEITKLVQISETVATMSIDAFETWLVDMLVEKVAQKIGAYIINGTGSSEPQGIEKANTWDATNSVTVANSANLTAANVQTLIGLLPGGYDANAKFLMSKKTLFTQFMPLQDSSKNKLVTNENNTYYVYGYPVMLDDNVALNEAYLGDFKKMVANLPQNVTVKSAFDIDTNSYKYLGVALFDCKVAVGEAFVKLIKAGAA